MLNSIDHNVCSRKRNTTLQETGETISWLFVIYNSNVELLTFRISVKAWLKRITENRLSCLNKLRGFILVNIQTYKKNIQCLFVFILWNFILCCFVYGRINKCISYSVFFVNFSGILSRFFFGGGGYFCLLEEFGFLC